MVYISVRRQETYKAIDLNCMRGISPQYYMNNQGSTKLRTPIPSLFCLKALCALLVVIIHSEIWGKEFISPILGLAVPCFFAISGYFLFSDNKEKEIHQALKWAKKALFLQIFLLFIYWSFFKLYNHSEYVWQTYIIAFFSGTGIVAHLWYLAALWQALLFFALLRRYMSGIVAIMISALLGDYVTHAYLLPMCPFNATLLKAACFSALFNIGGGYMVAKYQLKKYATPLLLVTLILSTIALHWQASDILSKPATNTLHIIAYTAASASILALCVKYPSVSTPWAVNIGKYHAANIYYYHIIIATLLPDVAIYLFGIDTTAYSAWVTYVLTLLLSIVIMIASRHIREIFSISIPNKKH